MKRQSIEREKMFANNRKGKGLISKIYKQLIQLNTKTPHDPIKKFIERLNRHFPKKTYREPVGHMKCCSTVLITREMHMKGRDFRYKFQVINLFFYVS